MKVRSLILFLILVGLIGFVGWSLYTQPEWLDDAWRYARGYKPAKTPQEAIDNFKAAVKNRDYKTAAYYCTRDYAEQLRKAHVAASKLAQAVDNLSHNLEQEGIKSDTTRAVLLLLEPFPKEIKTGDIKQQGETSAVAYLIEDTPASRLKPEWREAWDVDRGMFRTLVIDLPSKVDLVADGSGDAKAWKINFPVSGNLRQSVDHLRDNYQNYVRALDKVKYEIKRDAATKADVEARLREELTAAK